MRLSCKIILNFVTYINFYSNMQNTAKKKERLPITKRRHNIRNIPVKCRKIYGSISLEFSRNRK